MLTKVIAVADVSGGTTLTEVNVIEYTQ